MFDKECIKLELDYITVEKYSEEVIVLNDINEVYAFQDQLFIGVLVDRVKAAAQLWYNYNTGC